MLYSLDFCIFFFTSSKHEKYFIIGNPNQVAWEKSKYSNSEFSVTPPYWFSILEFFAKGIILLGKKISDAVASKNRKEIENIHMWIYVSFLFIYVCFLYKTSYIIWRYFQWQEVSILLIREKVCVPVCLCVFWRRTKETVESRATKLDTYIHWILRICSS